MASNKPVTAAKLENNLDTVSKLYDADGDGKLSDLEKICMQYDTNHDGNFSILEVEKIVEDMVTAKKEARNMGRVAAGVVLVALMLCGALLGLMFAANEASKESHVNGSILKDLSGLPTQTKSLESFGAVTDLLKLKSKDLAKVKSLEFSAVRKFSDTNQPYGSTADSRLAHGLFEMNRVITGFNLNTQTGITFKTESGAVVVALDKSVEVVEAGNTYTVIVPAATRRLTESHGSKFQLYTSRDEIHSAHEHHRRLAGEDDETSSPICGMETDPNTDLDENKHMEKEVYDAANDMCTYENSREAFDNGELVVPDDAQVSDYCHAMANYFWDNQCYDSRSTNTVWVGDSDYCPKRYNENDWSDPANERMWSRWCRFKCAERELADFDDTCGPLGECKDPCSATSDLSQYDNDRDGCKGAGGTYDESTHPTWGYSLWGDKSGSEVCGSSSWGVWIPTGETETYCWYSSCWTYPVEKHLYPNAGPYNSYDLDLRPNDYTEAETKTTTRGNGTSTNGGYGSGGGSYN